ncbi:hypothetical protein TNCV_1512741 [Trichonephila clavipes]|nr:hypothetical protein TNCV_1512741 [Trichonephila clavipes]
MGEDATWLGCSQSGRQFSMSFFIHLWPYIGNNTAVKLLIKYYHCMTWCCGSDKGHRRSRRFMSLTLVVKVTDLWQACHEFEPSATEDLPSMGAMPIKFVENSNILPLVWCSS